MIQTCLIFKLFKSWKRTKDPPNAQFQNFCLIRNKTFFKSMQRFSWMLSTIQTEDWTAWAKVTLIFFLYRFLLCWSGPVSFGDFVTPFPSSPRKRGMGVEVKLRSHLKMSKCNSKKQLWKMSNRLANRLATS